MPDEDAPETASAAAADANAGGGGEASDVLSNFECDPRAALLAYHCNSGLLESTLEDMCSGWESVRGAESDPS